MPSIRITDVTQAGAYVNALNAANESASRAMRRPASAATEAPERRSLASRAGTWAARLRAGLRTALRVARAATA